MRLRAIYSDGREWSGEPCDWPESPLTRGDAFGVIAVRIFFNPSHSGMCDGHSYYAFQEQLDCYRIVTYDEYTEEGRDRIYYKDGRPARAIRFNRTNPPKDIEYRQGAWMLYHEYIELRNRAENWQQ